MKVTNSIIGGIIVGMGLSIGTWLLFNLILIGLTYQIEINKNIMNISEAIGAILLLISIPMIGAYPALRSKCSNIKEGAIYGGIGGFVAAIIFYLMIGSLYNTLYLGVIPFVEYTAYPEKLLSINTTIEVMMPIVKDAIIYTYLFLSINLISGLIIGAIEGTFVFWIRSVQNKKLIKQ